MSSNAFFRSKGFLYGAICMFSVVLLSWFLNNAKVYPYGDGIEYVLMTEALLNHGSPDIQAEDIESYQTYLSNHELDIFKSNMLNDVKGFVINKEIYNVRFTTEKIDGSWGIILGSTEHLYPQHFWFYSALCVPARAMLELLDANISLAFLVTNVLLLIFSMVVIVQLNLSFSKTISLIALLVISPAFWYLHWPHPEVFAGYLTFLACILFFEKKNFWAMLLFCVLALHFQPLAIIALFILLRETWINRQSLNFKFIAKYYGSASIVFIPIIYNLVLFKTPSIIKKMGYLSFDRVNLNTLHSFFFDFNQGVIIAIPLFLILLLFFIVIDLLSRKNLRFYILPGCVLLMCFLLLQMINWNHGNEVVNRYVVWTSSILMVSVIYRIFQISNKTSKYALLSILFVVQLFVIKSQSSFKEISWDASQNNKLATYFYKNFPQYYNPDPSVFKGRVGLSGFTSTDSVLTYSDSSNQITKFMFQKKSIAQLQERGMNSNKLNNLLSKKRSIEGWYYINRNEFKLLEYDQNTDPLVITAMGNNK